MAHFILILMQCLEKLDITVSYDAMQGATPEEARCHCSSDLS